MEGKHTMKTICLFILLLAIAVPLLGHAEDKPLCEEYQCVAAFDFGFQFGFGQGSGSGEDVTNAIFITGTTTPIYLTGTTTILEYTH